MEAFLVAIVILALGGGSALVLSRQGWLAGAFPSLRSAGSAPDAEIAGDDGDDGAIGAGPTPLPLAPAATVPHSLPGVRPSISAAAQEPASINLLPAPADIGSSRLDRIESRLDELHRAVARHNEHVSVETRRVSEELSRRFETDEARRDASFERMRADMLALVSRIIAERQPASGARRMEVSAELYAQLARLESALATVTNPILLPGEPYAPPAELAAEALVWENWNEVGERAFGLAETYSAQRLHLSAQSRADVGEFVTTLRLLLTRSVYPNLQAEMDRARQDVLRDALADIAVELPRIRELLETEYLEGRTA